MKDYTILRNVVKLSPLITASLKTKRERVIFSVIFLFLIHGDSSITAVREAFSMGQKTNLGFKTNIY